MTAPAVQERRAILLSALADHGIGEVEAASILGQAWSLGWMAGHSDAVAHRVPATPDPFHNEGK